MNGKCNIVFGFIYLAFTALLGPAMLLPQGAVRMQAMNDTKQAIEKVKEDIQKGTVTTSNSSASAVVSMFDYLKSQGSSAKAPHVHGNLEALLNITAGVVLLSLAIPANFKSLLSIIFLVGAVFHSGMLYLGGVFGIYLAYKLTSIGAIAIVAGLLLMGGAAMIGIKEKVVSGQ